MKRAGALLTGLAVLCVLYGASVLSIIGAARWFNWAFVIIGAGLLALRFALPYLAKLGKGAKRALCLLLALALAFFVFTEAEIAYYARGREIPDADYVIILGAKVERWGPSVEYSARIRAAADYLKRYPDCVAVTTGGKGADEPVSEGRAAAEMLAGLGIERERILIEEKSTTTEENFLFARALIEERYGGADSAKKIIVSSGFHLFRALRHAKSCGFGGDIGLIPSTGLRILLPQYYLREFAALVKEGLL